MEESMPGGGQNRLQATGRQNVGQSEKSAAPWCRQELLVAVRGGRCRGQAGNSLWRWVSTPKVVHLWGDSGCEWACNGVGTSHAMAAVGGPRCSRDMPEGPWPWATHDGSGTLLWDCGHGWHTLGKGHPWGSAAMGNPIWSKEHCEGLWLWATHAGARTSPGDCGHGSSMLGQGHWEADVAEEKHKVTRSGGNPVGTRDQQKETITHMTLTSCTVVTTPKGIGWAECNPQQKWGKLRLRRLRITVWLKLSLGKEEKRCLLNYLFNCLCFLFLNNQISDQIFLLKIIKWKLPELRLFCPQQSCKQNEIHVQKMVLSVYIQT